MRSRMPSRSCTACSPAWKGCRRAAMAVSMVGCSSGVAWRIRRPGRRPSSGTARSRAALRRGPARRARSGRPTRSTLPSGRGRDVAVAGDVGQGGAVADQEGCACASCASITLSRAWARPITSSGLYLAPNTVIRRAAAGPKAICPAATDNQACTSAWPLGSRGSQRRSASYLAGQVDQDGVGVEHDGAAVVEHRHLAEGVELEELGRLVRALHQVDVDQLVRQAHQRQRQVHAVRVARQRVAVELERGGHEFFQWDGWGSRASEWQPAPANERGGRRKRCDAVTVPTRGATRNPRRIQGCLPDFAMIRRQR